jgi:hypothetical protein
MTKIVDQDEVKKTERRIWVECFKNSRNFAKFQNRDRNEMGSSQSRNAISRNFANWVEPKMPFRELGRAENEISRNFKKQAEPKMKFREFLKHC